MFLRKGVYKINSKEQLNEYVSDEEIMLHYYGDFSPGRHHKCPFKIEKNPSFYIHYWNEKLRWTRFGMFDDKSFDVIELVMRLEDIGFYDALNKIHHDIYVKGNRKSQTKVKKLKDKKKGWSKQEKKIIYCEGWNDETLKYWKDYKFDEDHLVKHDVAVCEELWIGKKLFHRYQKDEPFYVFLHDIDREIYTCYKPIVDEQMRVPYAMQDRFRKNNTSGHVMGVKRCKGGKIGFITSSKKEIMTFDRLGFDSIAPHTESGWRYKEFLQAVMYMKKEYDYVYVAFDNDSTGVTESIELTKQFGLNYWNVPKYTEGTDPSDAVKHHGDDFVISSLEEKFRRDGI